MTLSINFSKAFDVPCELCGWLDDSGGVEMVDDQRVSKVLCHQCTVDLVRKCLPNSRFESYDPTFDLEPVALAS